MRPCTEEDKTKLAIAACFHDLGLWSDCTLDYIPPAVSRAAEYLANTGQQAWSEEIALMIDMPHKVRAYTDRQYPLVELFRMGDLVDLSWGVVRYGIPRSYVTAVQKQFPNHGFHRFLIHSAAAW